MQISNRVQSLTEEIYKFTNIIQNKALMQARNYRVPQFPPIIDFTHEMISIYSLFENRLSDRKEQLLQLYRKIIEKVEGKEVGGRSLEEIVS